MLSSAFTSLPFLPLALAGLSDSQTQINGVLMLQSTAWAVWAVLVLVGDDNSTFGHGRGRPWLAAFLALKTTALSLLFTSAQSTAWDRELLQETLYVGVAAVGYALWGQFLVRRYPEARAPRWFRVIGWTGIASWLAVGAVAGPAAAWRVWPWLVAAPVMAGAIWAAGRERRVSFAALGVALLIEFADPHTVLAWYAGFVPEMSLTWTQLAQLRPGTERHAPGNGLLVVPVGGVALTWFAVTMVAVWTGFLAWQFNSRARWGRSWLMPLAALGLTFVSFGIYGINLAVAFRSMSRETFSRLATLATVAPWTAGESATRQAEWQKLRVANSELGTVFRWELTPDGRRLLLDPLAGYPHGELSMLPIERDTVARSEAYGLGPFMDPRGASFYSAVPAGRSAEGAPQWLAVIGPLERFYVYKRPTALLGTVLMFLFGLVSVVLFGYVLHRERALRQQLARERAEESARLKTTFLAKVSHELRTPLQSLLGYSQLIENAITEPMPRQHLQALRQHGDLMLRLVNDLLDLSAIESGAFRLVNRPAPLGKIIEQSVASMQPAAHAKHLALHCTIDPGLPPWVATDAERLRQVALNLIGNALKFTEKGRVDVTLRAVATMNDALTLELAVADTGPGIAPEHHSRLFRAFSRLELATPKEGAGLGLALSAALCRSAGGSLSLESDGRTGSRFIARFCAAPAVAPPPSVPSTQLPSLRGRRILVVDDNALVRDLFATWLTELGARCESAADGVSALAGAEAATFDAVVIDLAMPNLDGLEVTRRWRAQGRTWRIVGVSAHAGAKERSDALAAGMDAFLVKPVDLTELTAALAVEIKSSGSGNAAAHIQLRSRLATLFRADAAAQQAAIADALARHDWPALKAAAHYLKSSASVVGDDRLYDACSAIEEAVAESDSTRAQAACDNCQRLMAPWTTAA